MGTTGSRTDHDPNRTFDVDYSDDESEKYKVENFGFVYRSRFKGPFKPEEFVEKYPGQVRVIRGAKLMPESSIFKGRPSYRRLECERYLQIVLAAMRLYPKCANISDDSIFSHVECTEYEFYASMLKDDCGLKVIKNPPPPRSSSRH